jgi:amidase
MLDVTSGPEPGSMYEASTPKRQYFEETGPEVEPLRIAFSSKSPIGTKVHPDCIAAVEHSAKLLEQLGHKIEEADPEIDGPRLARAFLCLVFAEVATDLDQLQHLMGRKLRTNELEEMTWVMGLVGRSLPAVDLARARRQWGDAARAMGRFHLAYDLFMTPTMAYPPSRIGELKPSALEIQLMKWTKRFRAGGLLRRSGIVDGLAEKVLERVPFTPLANMTGQPAVSVPLYWNSADLPIGVQFVAPIGDEATLIRLGAQLERAEPWFEKRPPIFAD